MKLIRLVPHPALPCPHRFDLCVRPTLDGSRLRLDYQLAGDLRCVLIPPRKPTPQRQDELWQHLCFEAFIRVKPAAPYWELNFSPSGDWAIYRFEHYRQGMATPDLRQFPHLQVQRGALSTPAGGDASLSLTAVIDLAHIDPSLTDRPLQLALASVIETRDGERFYWAMHHASHAPDFHHPDSFIHPIPFSFQEPTP